MPQSKAREMEAQLPLRGHGSASDATAGLPDLPYVRLTQRQPPPPDRRGKWLVFALVLAVHVLIAWLIYRELRPAPPAQSGHGVMTVKLVEPQPTLPPPPPLVPPPPLPARPAAARPAPPPPRVHHEAPAKGAIQATLEGSKAPVLHLYQSNGEIRVPPPASASQATPAYRTPELQGSHIDSGKSPVPYKPTPFAEDFAPTNQSLGAKTVGRAFDKAVKKTTLKKTIHLPGGVKIHCAVAPLLLMAAGCGGDGPPPPPSNDDDIRLSMPPAETLTGKKVKVPASASSVPPPASH